MDIKNRAQTKPISLYPEQIKFATKRSLALGMSLSRYFQKLAEHDRTNNIMGKILADDAKRAA